MNCVNPLRVAEWPSLLPAFVGPPELRRRDGSIAVLGIDFGQKVCSLVGLDAREKLALRRHVKLDLDAALSLAFDFRITLSKNFKGEQSGLSTGAIQRIPAQIIRRETGRALSKRRGKVRAS